MKKHRWFLSLKFELIIKNNEYRSMIWTAQKLISIEYEVLNKNDFEYKASKVYEFWVWSFEYNHLNTKFEIKLNKS